MGNDCFSKFYGCIVSDTEMMAGDMMGGHGKEVWGRAPSAAHLPISMRLTAAIIHSFISKMYSKKRCSRCPVFAHIYSVSAACRACACLLHLSFVSILCPFFRSPNFSIESHVVKRDAPKRSSSQGSLRSICNAACTQVSSLIRTTLNQLHGRHP